MFLEEEGWRQIGYLGFELNTSKKLTLRSRTETTVPVCVRSRVRLIDIVVVQELPKSLIFDADI